jgi:hypothetical protein
MEQITLDPGSILEENELLDHVKQILPEPEEEDAKAKFRKNKVKAKRILTDSIKDLRSSALRGSPRVGGSSDDVSYNREQLK